MHVEVTVEAGNVNGQYVLKESTEQNLVHSLAQHSVHTQENALHAESNITSTGGERGEEEFKKNLKGPGFAPRQHRACGRLQLSYDSRQGHNGAKLGTRC